MAGRRLCGVFLAALHESSGSVPELDDALLPSFGELSEAQIRSSLGPQASPEPKPIFLFAGSLDGVCRLLKFLSRQNTPAPAARRFLSS